MRLEIDGSLYPDEPPPAGLESLADRVDFLSRLCSSWDFGILPLPDTVASVLDPAWREAVDQCRLLTSPAYHLLREWHHLPVLPFLGSTLSEIRDDDSLRHV